MQKYWDRFLFLLFGLVLSLSQFSFFFIFRSPEFVINKSDAPLVNIRALGSKQRMEERMKRTAVVWTTRGVTSECEATRLRHLVETTTTAGVDVWALHDHEMMIMKGFGKEVNKSLAYMKEIPGLKLWHQNTFQLGRFDGASGSSKHSFLRFLVRHPQYDFAWLVENDMFYTGPWVDILGPETKQDNTTDFLTSTIFWNKEKETPVWWYLNECQMFHKDCRQFESTQVGWVFARVSQRLANSLLGDLLDGHINGHHEAITGPYCTLKNFSLSMLHDPTKMGAAIEFGHVGNTAASKDVASFDPAPGTLIHPVKCEAYNNNKPMQTDIEKWTKP